MVSRVEMRPHATHTHTHNYLSDQTWGLCYVQFLSVIQGTLGLVFLWLGFESWLLPVGEVQSWRSLWSFRDLPVQLLKRNHNDPISCPPHRSVSCPLIHDLWDLIVTKGHVSRNTQGWLSLHTYSNLCHWSTFKWVSIGSLIFARTSLLSIQAD